MSPVQGRISLRPEGAKHGVVFAIPVQAFGRIRASRYKLTDVLISCHVAEFLKRVGARSRYTVTCSLSRYREQIAKTMTSLCTLLSVLGTVMFFT